MAGAFALNVLANLAIGALALFLESSLKIIELYLALFFLASGYLVPVALYPAGVRAVIEHLPFRFQQGLPVELLVGTLPPGEVLPKLAEQWAWVLVLLLVTHVLWRRGLARFAAYGG
jgi:ABC-2 type transport system permease protein